MNNSSAEPTVGQLASRQEIESTFPIMRQLRPHLVATTYVATIERLQADGFKLAGVTVAGQLVAVAGYRFGESLAYGRHCYVDDLVTGDGARSHGHGKMLLDWLIAQARLAGCQALHLDSGVQRHGAHRFYLRERFDIVSHHFKISLA